MPKSRVAKRQRSESEALAPILGFDAMSLPVAGYESTESCNFDWCTAHAEVAIVRAEHEVLFAGVPYKDAFSVLLANDSGWTQDISSVDICLVEMWKKYRAELVAVKLRISCTFL